jgi:anti-sigma regulatory factor (Ser/Thr protein kinase)
MAEGEETRPKMCDRTDADITEDMVACLRQIAPMWLAMFPDTLMLHVRDTLDELEQNARTHGIASTGCMVVTYDAEEGKTEWSVIVGYRYDDPEPEADRG